MTLQKKVSQPPLEAESMTIDISEEVEDEIYELAEDTNETGKESEEIETIETAEVSLNRFMIGWLIKIEIYLKDIFKRFFKFYVPDGDAERNNFDDSSNIKIEHVEHIHEKNFVRYIPHSDNDARSDMRKNLKCDLCGEMFPCYSLLKQHKYERQGFSDPKNALEYTFKRP